MKKVKCLLSCFCAIALLAACSSQTSSTPFVDNKPWFNTSAKTTESVEYSVSRDRVTVDSSGNVILSEQIASGKLSLKISDDTPKLGQLSIELAFELTYNQKADELDRLKTDTITSKVVCGYNFAPISSERTVYNQARGSNEPVSYTISADYLDTKKATMDGKKDLTLSSVPFEIDNEALLYALRCFDYKKTASPIFRMAVLFDCFNRGSFFAYDMVARWQSELTTVNKLPAKLTEWGLEQDSDGAKVDCNRVSLDINSQNSGPSTELFFAASPFTNGIYSQDMMLVKFYSRSYDLSQLKESLRTTYTLASLTVTE